MDLEKRHLQKMIKKSAISLISYDAHLLPNSIKTYYEYVDEIILGIDKDRISWSNNNFSFDENALWKDLSKIDTENKISVIEEDFHKSEIAIENDNYERNFLKEQCEHDIIVSVDADENLLLPKEFFIDFLPLTLPYLSKYDICMTWATPYKEIDDTTLVIANHDSTPYFGETQGFITHKNSTFTYARWTDKSGGGLGRILSPLRAIHYSLCRDEDALNKKVHNIGHSDIAETDPFFDLWKQVTLENYNELKDFRTSGLGDAQWPALFPVKTEQLISYYEQFANRAYQ
jgi:hypothetical protein